MDWILEPLPLELKYTWKISRNSSDVKPNFLVRCRHNSLEGLGEVAPNIRYSETSAIIIEGFNLFLNHPKRLQIKSDADLNNLLNALELPRSLKFGINAAWVHYMANKNKVSIPKYLGIPEKKEIHSCYTFPIMASSELENFYKEYNLSRFAYLKVKVNAEEPLESIKRIAEFSAQPLIIDGNEAWSEPEAVLDFMQKTEGLRIEFIEQPMPSKEMDAYIWLKKRSPFPLMADESLLDNPDWTLLEQGFHGINMKLMKAGSYQKGIEILNEAKSRGFKTMTGCMIESTLGISSAFYAAALSDYADLDGCLIVANEPFSLLKEQEGKFSLA